MARQKTDFEDINMLFEAYIHCPSSDSLDNVITSGGTLVRHFALKYGCKCEFEDLYQSGMLGLMKAIKSYDRRTLFSTWASWCIISEIRHTVRSEHDFIELPVELQSDTATDETSFSTGTGIYQTPFFDNKAPDIVYDINSFHLSIEDQITLKQAMKNLSVLQKQVIDALFFKHFTQQQAAQALGLSQRKVSRVKINSLNILLSLLRDSG